MNKETIFISHSSKDSEAMNYFQKLLMKKTGSTFDIFLSSDGQSIPFGTNWIHKIEQGLNNAKIMFIFITPNSIKSNWIYFEAGYAYSKDIKVVPIGIGIDIHTIKPPLNLLQGFNINSFESINNCIKIINDEFKTTFNEDITSSEYDEFTNLIDEKKEIDEIDYIADYIETKIASYFIKESGTHVDIDGDEILNKCKEIIENNKYAYSSNGSRILSVGIKIDKVNNSKINILINIEELSEMFNILKEIIKESYQNKQTHYFDIILNDEFDLVVDDIKVSSLIKNIEDINFGKDDFIGYEYKDIKFILGFQNAEHIRKILFHKYIRIWFTLETQVSTIIELIKILKEIGIIYLKDEKE